MKHPHSGGQSLIPLRRFAAECALSHLLTTLPHFAAPHRAWFAEALLFPAQTVRLRTVQPEYSAALYHLWFSAVA
ncbi:hypothetical protein D3C76_296000 [compost metagenome]